MKYFIINPISYICNPAPVNGIPSVIGMLENAGINVSFTDLNLKYINNMLSDTSIYNFINFYDSIKNKYNSNIDDIFQNYDKNKTKLHNAIRVVNLCKIIMRHKEYFFNYILQCYAKNIIYSVCSSISSISDCIEEQICSDLNSYRNFSESRNFSINIELLNKYFKLDIWDFKNFYEDEIIKILDKKPDIIGVSINNHKQLIPGLYFCFLLKKKTNTHINIGGSFFDTFYNQIENLSELFNYYFDSISVSNNSNTPIALAEYIKGNIPINKVPCLIYKQKYNQIVKNPFMKDSLLKNLPIISFTGFDKKQYLSLELVLPIYTSISCYWRKCIFCSCYDNPFQQKPVSQTVKEIETLSKKYDTKYFYFWDNSISPAYLEEMADILIKKHLDIKYSIFARLEKEFTGELLKKAKQSGCLMIYFGLDSASDRVLEYINKGITVKQAREVLINSHKAGIFNGLYLILGHPTETVKDLKKDLHFINRNKKYINVAIVSPETLFVNGSKIVKDYKKNKSLIITTQEQRLKIYNKITSQFKYVDSHTVHNLIYLSKKGLNEYNNGLFFAKFILSSRFLFNLYLKYQIYKQKKLIKKREKW